MILKAGSRGRAAQVAVGQGRAGGERWPRQAVLCQGIHHQLPSAGEAADICGEGRNMYPTLKQKSRARAMPSLKKFVILPLIGKTAG